MKKGKLFCLLFLLCSQFSYSQKANHAIGIYFEGIDYYGPQTGNYLFQKKSSTTSKNSTLYWDPAIKVAYGHRLSSLFDLFAAVHISSLQMPTSAKDSVYILVKQGKKGVKQQFSFLAFDIATNLNLLNKEKYFLSPYIHVGVSYTNFQSISGIELPIGLGVNLKLAKSVYLNLESKYRMPITNSNQPNLIHAAGLIYWWGSKKNKSIVPIIPVIPQVPQELAPLDKDNDGVADVEDDCPTLPGKKTMKGCPDSDADGIYDNIDQCPQDSGLVRYKGCPIPDRDNDGFNDEIDACPDETFEANNGCPFIKKEIRQKVDLAAKGIYFKSNSAIIDSTSFKNLDEIAAIMLSQEPFILDIEGHTDNKGSEKLNLELSQKRADACRDYLVQKGISSSRIESIGYGDIKPIADNETEEGRAKNRRTEFVLKWTE